MRLLVSNPENSCLIYRGYQGHCLFGKHFIGLDGLYPVVSIWYVQNSGYILQILGNN